MRNLVDNLEQTRNLTDEELKALLSSEDDAVIEYLLERARAVRESVYGKDVYLRGLVE